MLPAKLKVPSPDATGPNRDLRTGWDRYTGARVNGDAHMIDWGNERILELKLAAHSGRIDGQHKSSSGTLALALQCADGPRQ